MAGEKCFFPKLRKKLETGVVAIAVVLGIIFVSCGLIALVTYLSMQAWAVAVGSAVAFGIDEILSWILSNFTLVLGLICAVIAVWAYALIREGKKQTAYSAIAYPVAPVGLTYLLIRCLFWTHLWTYDGKQANAGWLGVLISIIAFFTIWGLCLMIETTVLECFTDTPPETKTE